MSRERRDWVADQRYEGACRTAEAALRDLAEHPRMRGMKLRAEVLELVTKLEAERAHVVQVWD